MSGSACDFVIVTGDAFVDHPAFGSAVIARVLHDAGYRVGIIAQPDWHGPEPFRALGRPRLGFAITAGNVDSMLANYSPTFQRRRRDDYAPGGRFGLRPNRATTVYANRCREAYPDAPLIIGGVEASLRRLAHYDFREDRVRPSLLTDTRADILVYGMGERATLEIAGRLAAGEMLEDIPGTCTIGPEPPAGDALFLPSFEDTARSPDAFNKAHRLFAGEADRPRGRVLVQPHGDRYVTHRPMPAPMTAAELDRIYELPYTRAAHPHYAEPVPALEPVRFSITSHRGCLGSCSFCSLRAHQGRIIQWRSEQSLIREAEGLTRLPGFHGHITDVGGPTVNMYGATCAKMKRGEVCADRECTWPEKCSSLRLGYDRQLSVLAAIRRLPGVKKVSVGTGLRFDLLDGPAGESYLAQLCRHHISGQLRVAPEHVAPAVLKQMRKAPPDSYRRFRNEFRAANRRLGLRQFLVPYFIAGHPGATIDDAVALAEHLVREEKFFIRRVQQFTPLPMTAAAAAWYTGKDPLTGRAVHVARDPAEARLQRSLLQLWVPANYARAERELVRLGRADLLRRIRALRPLLAREDEKPRLPRGRA